MSEAAPFMRVREFSVHSRMPRHQLCVENSQYAMNSKNRSKPFEWAIRVFGICMVVSFLSACSNEALETFDQVMTGPPPPTYTPPSSSTDTPSTAGNTYEDTGALNSQGVSLGDAENGASQLEVGMNVNQVLKLIGTPDRKATELQGSKTDSPWMGTEWRYGWSGAVPNGNGLIWHKYLIITYKIDNGGLQVNDWNWY